MVDVTHSTGRKDIMLPPTAKAALALVLMELWSPSRSFCCFYDAGQQMDLNEFNQFYHELKPLADMYNSKKLK